MVFLGNSSVAPPRLTLTVSEWRPAYHLTSAAKSPLCAKRERPKKKCEVAPSVATDLFVRSPCLTLPLHGLGRGGFERGLTEAQGGSCRSVALNGGAIFLILLFDTGPRFC